MITKLYHTELETVMEAKKCGIWLVAETVEIAQYRNLRKRHSEEQVKDYEHGTFILTHA